MSDDSPTRSIASSPSASGPAGPLFEGQVGAHYLLTMLAEAEPRGMRGVRLERVEFQRAGEGHPLDDIVTHGVTNAGHHTVLEIQVKRTVTFSPRDTAFRDVVEQLSRAIPVVASSDEQRLFAVATRSTSSKISGPYQDVLRWARQVGSASEFMKRVERQNVANNDMRTFVGTVRSHLMEAGIEVDDESLWQVLRRFSILTFDYGSPGSQAEELALERARNLLDSSDASRAGALWKALTETAIRVAASGGDFNRTRLLHEVSAIDQFRLAGAPSSRRARTTLAEATLLAVADLPRTVAGMSLTRPSRLAEVREALDRGRYIEIRGRPGVGKSGLLAVLAEQMLREGTAIVLSPGRTLPGGWLAFKSALGIETTPEMFLSDLASDGGGTLFIDSLDFFVDQAKRATVTDLVRAATSVPGFRVIVTVRSDFDRDEPNWLPRDALTALGRAPAVIIDELNSDEVEELSAETPSLRALLADEHPARDIARNLFRLSRLLEVQGTAERIRSEVDLLERWWDTADGPSAGRRERAQLLSDLADIALAGGSQLDARAPAGVVEAMVQRGTIREIQPDQWVFGHDVLLDWAIAARLHNTPSSWNAFRLDHSVPASLARGLELGARFALERTNDGQRWSEYLIHVTRSDAHPSWRRWSLLAILRSEHALALLDNASNTLLANECALLRELIQTALAVEAQPMTEAFAPLAGVLAQHGVELNSIPAGIYVPTNTSWAHLTAWLLKRQGDLPLSALPDVVQLFRNYSGSSFFKGSLIPHIANTLADWLYEIENALDQDPLDPRPSRFSALRFRDHTELATDVRQSFLLMAAEVPERTRAYLCKQLTRRNPQERVSEIMKFSGTLAEVAPGELANLTLAALIPASKAGQRDRHFTRGEIFTHLDLDFVPSSPAQGPFFDLLKTAPEHGLQLVRDLVEHAVAARTDGAEAGDDGFLLSFPLGQRFFPWRQTYNWSRPMSGSGNTIESCLLALEAWAHARLERGDPVEGVIADVLGQEGSPAAFVLVAVDVLISHWPKTMAAAVPFVGSPELLAIDRERQLHDSMSGVDLLGLGAIGPNEPAGAVRLEDLQKRPSRHYALEALLGNFSLNPCYGEKLRAILKEASARLGTPEPGDTFAAPRFLVSYALNVIEPTNWKDVDGERKYVSPPDEAMHLQSLQRDRSEQTLAANLDSAIRNALKQPGNSNPDLVQRAVSHAQSLELESVSPEDVLRSRTLTVVSAALLLARDGMRGQFDRHENWARGVFERTIAGADDDSAAFLSPSLIRLNPVAIAALGLISLWHRGRTTDGTKRLFRLAAREDVSAAYGFGAGAALIRELDPRLPPALLRCALQAQVFSQHAWDASPEELTKAAVRRGGRLSEAIAIEMAWLDGTLAEEPNWPVLPQARVHVRDEIRVEAIGDPVVQQVELPEDDQLRSQAAAVWVRQLTLQAAPADLPWASGFIEAYAGWTGMANGLGLDPGTRIDHRMNEWNGVFYSLCACAFTHMPADQVDAQIAKVTGTPDESFFGIVDQLVPAVDQIYFDGLGIDLNIVLRLRTAIAERLSRSAGWRWERDRTEMSVERWIGPAIASLFFCQYNPFAGVRCYLRDKDTDEVDPFFPLMTRLISDGPVPFTALLTMKLLEVAPRPTQLPFLLSSALTWLDRQPANADLWNSHGLGAQLASWLSTIIDADPSLCSSSHPQRHRTDEILARLVQIGVAEAHSLEVALSTSEKQ